MQGEDERVSPKRERSADLRINRKILLCDNNELVQINVLVEFAGVLN